MEEEYGFEGSFAPVEAAVPLLGLNWASVLLGIHCGFPCCLPCGGVVYYGTGSFQAVWTLLGFQTEETGPEEARHWESHQSEADRVCRRSHSPVNELRNNS